MEKIESAGDRRANEAVKSVWLGVYRDIMTEGGEERERVVENGSVMRARRGGPCRLCPGGRAGMGQRDGRREREERVRG